MDDRPQDPSPSSRDPAEAADARGEWLPPRLHYFRAGDASIGNEAGPDLEGTS